jgi:hypothetical protein
MKYPYTLPPSITELTVVDNRLYVPSSIGTPIEIAGAIQQVVSGSGDRELSNTDTLTIIEEGSPSITLPNPASAVGRMFTITNAGIGTVTVLPFGTELIIGEVSGELLQYDSITLTTKGGNWSAI